MPDPFDSDLDYIMSKYRPLYERLAKGDPPDFTTPEHLAHLLARTGGPIDYTDIPESTGNEERVRRDADGKMLPRRWKPVFIDRSAVCPRLPRESFDVSLHGKWIAWSIGGTRIIGVGDTLDGAKFGVTREDIGWVTYCPTDEENRS